MGRLIREDDVIKAMEDNSVMVEVFGKKRKMIDAMMMCCDVADMPTVEARPVIHGEWLDARMNYVCSRCKTVFHDDIEWIQGEHKLPNFCPECGADMRKKVQE